MGRYPCSVHITGVESEEVTATPRGTGEMVRMLTKIDGSFVMHTFAPESAIDEAAIEGTGVDEAGCEDIITVTGTSRIGEGKNVSSMRGGSARGRFTGQTGGIVVKVVATPSWIVPIQ